MTPAEVERVHRVFNAIDGDDEKAVEMLADLRAYFGMKWPVILQEALRRYKRDRRGDE